MMHKVKLEEAYQRMLTQLGVQNWWPADTAFEVIVGAVLTQNTNWRNVERAIGNLRDASALSLLRIHEISTDELEPLLRPAGYYRIKSRRLKNVADFIVRRYETVDKMFLQPLDRLRRELLTVHGIGPETADSILLYAGGKPTFVIDAYTHRIATRHGWVDPAATYDDLKRQFESALERDANKFAEYHALIVEVGKRFCKPSPLCEGCPLQPMIPSGGLVGEGTE